MEDLKNSFRDFDFISSIVGIRYGNQWRYKTIPGAISSLLFILLSLGILGFFSYQFIIRSSLNMVTETVRLWDPPVINLSDFKFGVGMNIGTDHKIHDDLFDIEFQRIFVNTSTGVKDIQSFTHVPCKVNDFSSAVEQYLFLGIQNFYCFSASNFTIQGQPQNDFYSYARISFEICKPSEKKNCSSIDKIFEVLKHNNVQASLYYLGSAFQFQNRSQFVKKLINSIPNMLSANMSKETNVYFAANQLSVQNGYIFDEAPEVMTEIMLDSTRDISQINYDFSSSLLNFNIYSSRIQSNTFLSYMQFSQLLANLGGVLNGTILILNALLYYINNIIYQAEFIEKVYRIKNKDSVEFKKKIKNIFDHLNEEELRKVDNIMFKKGEKKNESNEINREILQFVDPSMPQKILKKITEEGTSVSNVQNVSKSVAKITEKNNLFEGNLTNDKLKEINDIEDKFQDMIDFYPYDIVKISICSCFGACSNDLKRKTDIYEFLRKHLDTTQDFFNIFKKMIEIDLIKHLLFDKDQLTILKYLMKPEVLLPKDFRNQNKDSFSRYFNDNYFHFLKDENYLSTIRNEEKDLIVGCLNNIVNKQLKTTIDEKIVRNIKRAFN